MNILTVVLLTLALFLATRRPRPQAIRIAQGFKLPVARSFRAAVAFLAVAVSLQAVPAILKALLTTFQVAVAASVFAIVTTSLTYAAAYRCELNKEGVHLRTLFGCRSLSWPEVSRVDISSDRRIVFFATTGRDIRLSLYLDGAEGIDLALERFAPQLLSADSDPRAKPQP